MPSQAPSPKFFITHSSKDIEFARRLCDDLKARGLDGFFDAYSIKPGDKISVEINRGLEACDIYMPILSHASLKSPWCEEEIHAAIALSNRPERNHRPRIVSLLVEDCEKELPPLLLSRLYINFAGRYEQAIAELFKGLDLPPRLPPALLFDFRKPFPPLDDMLKGTSRLSTPPPTTNADADKPKTTLEEYLSRQITIGRLDASLTDFLGRDDSIPQTLEIPAGDFLYGPKKEKRTILRLYRIGMYPVTNAQYKKFVDATAHRVPFVEDAWAAPYNWNDKTREYPEGKARHPVVLVDWSDASAYCNWLSKTSNRQFRLPTEEEWERAARGTDGRRYPWGDTFDQERCNTAESGIKGTTPVDRYPGGISPSRAWDMIGNVAELTGSQFGLPANSLGLSSNPLDWTAFWIRGGSWQDAQSKADCVASLPVIPLLRLATVGFRVVEVPSPRLARRKK